MGYELSPGISFCRIGDRFLFLDLVRDRYFALADAADQVFAALLAGDQADRDELERLVAQGLLVETPGTKRPLPFCPPPDPVSSLLDLAGAEDRAGAAAALARRLMSVRARLSSFSHPLLMLSGGLDSTILASCLAADGKPFTCLNLVSTDASGDERHYARAAAAAFGAPCFEAYRQPASVDLALSGAAALPWPLVRSFVQDSAQSAADTAVRLGADVVVDGGGGDNVFCALQSVAPLADALRVGEPFGHIHAIARSIAQLAEVAELTVLRRAAYRAWFRRDAFRTVRDATLLTATAVAATEPAPTHPWLADMHAKAPGKAAYVALLAIAQAWVEGQDAARSPLTLSPLVAQPVIELGLRIPSWFWFEGGGNRAVARAAFADVLPPAIHARQSKATPDSFVLELFERNRARIRDLLCDGLLAGQDMLDLPRIERILADPRPAQGRLPQRVMRLVDVEAWARAWMLGEARRG
jgi:asparagine synthase (glutamine-hydrolysing)